MKRKLVSILAVSILALIGLWGSNQVAYAQGRAYVTNNGDNNVSVIDTSSNTVVAKVGVGSGPEGVAITPDGTRAYVANCGSSVWVIDTSSNTVVAKVASVGSCPYGVAITPDGTRAYVTDDNGATVAVINTSSNTVITKVGVGATPAGVAITPDGTRAYVASAGTSTSNGTISGTVSVIDTSSNTVVAKVSVGGVPGGVAITPDGTRAYVATGVPNLGGSENQVAVINTSSNTVVATVDAGGGNSFFGGVAITPDGTRAYVATVTLIGSGANAGFVSVIDTSSNTVIAKVGVNDPIGVAITPDGTRAYVTNDSNFSGASSVSVIDTSSNTVVATVGVGGIPSGVAVANIPVKGSVTPVVPSNGVINNAGFSHSVGGGLTVSPGLIAAIFGTNLSTAPASGVAPGFRPGTSSLFTTFQGTSVTFDGTPAPLYFLSPGQVNVQVPFEVAGKTSTQVVLTLNGRASAPVTVPVMSATPGIVTVNSSGAGAAVVLNQDSTLNTAANQAARGDIIQIYATGLGLVSPAVITGQAAPSSPLSHCASTPTATIGGVPVMVSSADSPSDFCGLAPFFVGLWQVNVKVPTGIGTGAVPLLLTIGGVTSNAVTVFVK